jgi:hypothetical protein
MSLQLINLNPDLKRLRDEGFEIGIKAPYLFIKNVPYVNSKCEVKRGTLVAELSLNGDKTIRPHTHVVFFEGEHPCHKNGQPIEPIRHSSENKLLADGLSVNHQFSNKPPNGYDDHYQKVTRYIEIVGGPARAIDSTADARTFAVVETKEGESVFQYFDTSSSRSDIFALSEKVKGQKIAIIGLGGTGSYILDLVSKTPVAEIHLFDGDEFLQHNAFRAPGAAPKSVLDEKVKKTDYFQKKYSEMHRKIFSHPYKITPEIYNELTGFTFVFICIDKGGSKGQLFQFLQSAGISFIDVGMGITRENEMLAGIIRTTSSTNKKQDHLSKRISFVDTGDDEYTRNIQTAELNALNATLAVIKWKKIMGIYRDSDREHHTTYTLDVNMLLSEEHEA